MALLAVLALVASAAGATAGQPPGWVPPNWNKRPTAEAIHAVWPRRALMLGVNGAVQVRCQVNIRGAPENCMVVEENPTNLGFGAAALLLTPDFLFTPARLNGVPVSSSVVVPIDFKIAGPLPVDLAPAVTIIDRPEWSAAPTFAQTGAAYPRAAGGAPGYVALRCGVKGDGSLRSCSVLREEPPGKGFGLAARSLVPLFRMTAADTAAAARQPTQVNLPIRLIDPASAGFTDRVVGEPQWTRVLDSSRTQALYPADASAKGVRTGVGVARCTVAADGALIDCSPGPGRPDGLGFSEAAVMVAKVMVMNRWTQEGGPIDGATISLPIRFNLADGAK